MEQRRAILVRCWGEDVAALSYSTVAAMPQSRENDRCIALETHRCPCASGPIRRSCQRAIVTSGWRAPRRSASIEYPKLCQSMTSLADRSRAAIHAMSSVGIAGGFWTSTTSGFGNRNRSKRTSWAQSLTSFATAERTKGCVLAPRHQRVGSAQEMPCDSSVVTNGRMDRASRVADNVHVC